MKHYHIFIDYINDIFNVNRGEWTKISVLSLYSALAVSVLVIVQSMINALFLERYDASYLPYLFSAQALFYVAVSTVQSSLVERYNREDETFFLLGLLISSLLVSRFLLIYEFWWFVFILYVLLQTLVDMFIVRSTANVTATFDVRSGKRLAPIIDAGGTLGAVAGGVAVTASVSRIGSENLLFVCIPLVALNFYVGKSVFNRYLAKGLRNIQEESVGRYSYLDGVKTLFKDLGREKLMVTFSILFAAMIMASTIIDFQFKTMLKRTYAQDEIAAFLGLFYALLNSSAILVQLLLSSRILLSLGLIFTIGLLPALLFSGAAIFLFFPFLSVIAGTRFIENVLRYSLHKAATTLVFMPYPPVRRDRLRIATKGIIKPVAIVASSSILIVIGNFMELRLISLLVIIVCLMAIKSAFKMKSSYVSKLNESLSSRRVRLEKKAILSGGPDRQIIETIEDGLALVEKDYVLFSLEIVRDYKLPVARKKIEALLDNPDNCIRRNALLTIKELENPEFTDALVRHLSKTKNKEEVALCVKILRHLGAGEVLADVEAHAGDDDREVRGEVLLYMITSGNRVSRERAEAILRELSMSTGSGDLMLAASVAGESGMDKYIPLLKSLIGNSDQEVRKEAALAAGKSRLQEMLPFLMPLLQDRSTRRAARKAIADYGESCLPFLRSRLYSQESHFGWKREIISLVGSIPCQESIHLLATFLSDAETTLTEQVILSLRRLNRAMPGRLFKYRERLKKTVEREVDRTCRVYYLLFLLDRDEGGSHDLPDEKKCFMSSELNFKIKGLRQRIFGLLEFLYGEKIIYKAYLNYLSEAGRNRSNSLELLENILDMEMARLVIPVLEEMSPERRIRMAGHKLAGAPRGRHALFHSTQYVGDDWIKSVIGWSFEQRDEEINPWEGVMMQMMERIFFLKSVPLFSGLSGEELKPVAEMFSEVSFKKNTVLFRENDASDNFYLIMDGRVKVVKGEIEIAILEKGDYFGEMALLDHEPRSATIIVVEDSDFLQLGREDFYEIIDEHPVISRGIITTLSKRLRTMLEMKSG